MKTHVRESSIENHHINEAILRNQNLTDRIEDYVKAHGWVTRRQIAVALDEDTATISGRVTPMIQPGGPLVECAESEKRPCPITGRRVLFVTHRSRLAGTQPDMFGGVQ
jgi:hypothetical protein